ncbi:hypothetical protein IPT68_02175 [Streptomyces chromofuscus]|uniref:Uncharacterized protein n=1 Tax=Streptomyces chromofuscus TaxID=42881 RepID=A0A7M2T9B4_STRCW|nr:hypothetical protein IPT68_02175 [Streptomyces chromofuscus]
MANVVMTAAWSDGQSSPAGPRGTGHVRPRVENPQTAVEDVVDAVLRFGAAAAALVQDVDR